jgi:seryl-tRNA synthetase
MEYHFNIKAIRENPEAFDAGLARRGIEPYSSSILSADSDYRKYVTLREQAQAERKEISRQVGVAKKNKDEATASDLMLQADRLQSRILIHDRLANEAKYELEAIMLKLPNLPAHDVPEGKDEKDNVFIRQNNVVPKLDGTSHWNVPLAWGFDDAAKITGSRFSALSGPVARLHRALGQFMIDEQIKRGYKEVIPPTVVRPEALFGTGQLPKFEEDLFKVVDGDNERYLIPTAEVPLTNVFADSISNGATGPRRLVAITDCYRAEAGSAGRDTRGMIRQHQFQKVELVSVCEPSQSEAEHEYMVESAEAILDKLGLPYRRMLLCAGDMGFSAQKTYDLEVWLPGQNAYREISSVSNCGDFQARRMNARYKINGETVYAHTLNGSGLAVGRTLVAVVENYVTGTFDVEIPAVLQPYMLGAKFLSELE